MRLTTQSVPYSKALATNATDASFPARIPTTTEPTGDGVHELALDEGGVAPNSVMVVPYGVGADNDTFSMRVLGWRLVGTLWVPTILAQLACTLSAAVGVAGAAVVATERFADTLSLVALMGNQNVDVVITSPANDTPGHAVIDLKGSQKVEFVFDLTGATSANCLKATL